ncbi:hypothetical protein [Vallitalea guaymasensis]|uniref:hypothetical protein n=1 Tax=Vallitalea guaymasensis TaxID=1185412 RepID=UPI000DE393B8|nr:hypothetical protein [Vallitalea guaymasensis]
MKRLKILEDTIYTDMYCVDPDTDDLLFASLFCREGNKMKAVTSRIQLSFQGEILEMESNVSKKVTCRGMKYSVFFQNYKVNKDQVVHSLVVTEQFKAKGNYLLVPNKEQFNDSFYNKLLLQFDYPILEEWISYIIKQCNREGYLQYLNEDLYVSRHLRFNIANEIFDTKEMLIVKCTLTDNQLQEIIRDGLSNGDIYVTRTPQRKLEFKSLNEYVAKYGHTIVDSLRKSIQPISDSKGVVENIITINKTPFPQQAKLINGLAALMGIRKFGIMNEGMGCGKTLQGAALVEKYYVDKFLKQNKSTSVEAVENIKYRNIIMCPSHLVEKWEEEIIEEIPLAKVIIIEKFSQLINLRKKGKQRTEKEFFVISKDFCKLSYMQKPTPTVVAKKKIRYSYCKKCYHQHTYNDYLSGKKCDNCQGELKESDRGYAYGLICPSCGELLFPYTRSIDYEHDDFEDKFTPLGATDFAGHKKGNSRCSNCGESLWQPYVKNLTLRNDYSNWSSKHEKWVRITHYKNKNRKTMVTSWVHKDFINDYLSINEVEEYEYSKVTSFRKYAPSWYIKKYLRGFFDFAIFDECHDLKGETAQGHAMHAIIKASKRYLPLTGTIAGGYAHHLFYLFYRLVPGKMRELGYEYSDVNKFSKDFGVVEETYIYENEEDAYNSSSRGRKVTKTPTVRPGINPLIFPKLLLGSTVFLDLSDLAAFLPPLYENVLLVDMPTELEIAYNNFINSLKDKAKNNFGLFSVLLQYGLSYPDKPYNMDTIYDPKTGNEIYSFVDFDKEKIWPKEQTLIDLVNKEVEEGRNCFIYMEFTGDGDKNVCNRIKKIIEDHCHLDGKVAYMKSSSPNARKRQSWIRKMASKGIKVFITNYRCTQTGLDFIFKVDNVIYNYPTIIFYQMGTNMFAVWQAACRHYRLSQKEECRTFYLAYKNTLQAKLLRLIAEKKVATAAIQGKFSAEGLAAMANGVDLRVKLAQTLSESDEHKESLTDMFDKVNQVNHRELSDEEKAFLAKMNNSQLNESTNDDENIWDFMVMEEGDIEVYSFDNLKVVENSKSKKIIEGQLSFF